MNLPADTAKAQWDYILATCQTEMASGRLKNVSWTDASGTVRAASLGDVRRSLHLFTQQPAGTASAGVMLSSWDASKYASNRRWLVTEFTFRISVQAVAYTSGNNTYPANGDDALAQAYAFVSDGIGNGIAEIFRDVANYNLGGNAVTSMVTKVAPFLQIGDGETPQVFADLYVTLRAEKPLAV